MQVCAITEGQTLEELGPVTCPVLRPSSCLCMRLLGTSLVVQGLKLCACNAGHLGSTTDQGTKIPHAMGEAKRLKIINEQTSTLTS